jgi:leucyl-tRNA synthetase
MHGTNGSRYDHSSIEKKWQEEWQKDGIYTVPDSIQGKENFYALVEFTYPSGNLHVGHWYAYSVPDVFARYKRMQGYNVLYPIGFDAFGLPAENAAIKLGADPKIWTFEQMDKMRIQLRSMGAMFDWNREIVSCDPGYYKWTQWMFNQFLKKALVYRDVTKVNWCPKDQTILANEQVENGKCGRCGTAVEQRDQEQWMFRITKYADRLIDDLDKLNWPEEIKAAQRNWIGRNEGSEITFTLSTGDTVPVFTTRADTLFGVTYIVLAPEHALVQKLLGAVENKEDVQTYIDATRKKLELERQQSKEKTGVELKGITAINPANNESVSVWIADYVLAGYGTGAVMAVPAHDERDFEFANKFNLQIKYVVAPYFVDKTENSKTREGVETLRRIVSVSIVKHPTEEKYLMLDWKNGWTGFITGGIEAGEDEIEGAIREIQEETGYKNIKFIKRLGNPNISTFYAPHKDKNQHIESRGYYFELLDEEQNAISDSEHEKHTVLWKNKDEVLSFIKKGEEYGDTRYSEMFWSAMIDGEKTFTDYGILLNSNNFSGLESAEAKQKITQFVGGKMVKTYRLRDWGISRQRYWGCPIPIVYDPDGKAHPVPDEHLPWLLPTDVDHTPSGVAPLAKSAELLERTETLFGKGWKPEVETMDTFVDSSWYFYRYLDNKNDTTFADKKNIDAWMPIDLYMGGPEHTTMHLLYSRFWVKALHDLGLVKDDEAYTVRRNRGLILGPDGNKMSKSKGNVIDPDEVVEKLGADTVRLYLCFMGPYGVTGSYPWDPNGVVGVRRFLERVWRLKEKIDIEKKICKTDSLVHKTIRGMTEDIELFKFNTAVSKMMILINAFEKEETLVSGSYRTLLKLLAPFAPHMTEELWHDLGETTSIHLASWPSYDGRLIVDDVVTIAVQINGKVRGELTVSNDTPEDTIREQALALPRVQPYLEGKTPVKVIVVPGRIVNIVL